MAEVKKIKIVHIIESLEVGGAQQILVEIAKNINKKIFDIQVISLQEKKGLADELRACGAEVIMLKQKNNYGFAVLPNLIKILKSRKPQIVHTWLFGADFWGRIAAILAGVTLRVSSVVSIYKVYGFKNHLADRMLEPFTSKFIFCNDSAIDFARKKSGVKDKKVIKIMEPIDLGKYLDVKGKISEEEKSDFMQKYGLKRNIPCIGVIARLEEQKGIKYFIEAARIIDKQFKAQFLIVGEGSLMNDLKAYANEEKMNSPVIFTGLQQNLPLVYSLLDTLVISSIWEGKPLVMLYAMAAGVPVVGFAIDGVKEALKDNFTGFLCTPEDERSLAEGINRAVTGVDVVGKIKMKAKEYVCNNYESREVIREYEKIYEGLLRG